MVLRLGGVDLPGNIKVGYALPRVRGVGYPYSNAILRVLDIDPNMPLGLLTEEQVSKLEAAIRSPEKHGLPSWLFNRQKDPRTGVSVHAMGPDLLIDVRKDVETMIKTKSWKGVRHSIGLKVRGQRTKTTGRLGQTVGVKRKGIVQAQQSAQPQPQAQPQKSEAS